MKSVVRARGGNQRCSRPPRHAVRRAVSTKNARRRQHGARIDCPTLRWAASPGPLRGAAPPAPPRGSHRSLAAPPGGMGGYEVSAVSTACVENDLTSRHVGCGRIEQGVRAGRVEADIETLVRVPSRWAVHATETLEVARWHSTSLLRARLGARGVPFPGVIGRLRSGRRPRFDRGAGWWPPDASRPLRRPRRSCTTSSHLRALH